MSTFTCIICLSTYYMQLKSTSSFILSISLEDLVDSSKMRIRSNGRLHNAGGTFVQASCIFDT